MSDHDPFGKRPGLLVRQSSPYNGGPAPEWVIRGFETPNELFFVRNHGDVPAVDPEAYRLTVDGLVRRPLSLSLDEIRHFPKATVAATLQCAGNRRLEMMAVEPIPHELPWGTEAISNAVWGGVPLCDLLAAAEPRSRARHAAFLGLDETERHGHRFHFGGSVPLAKALGPEVLLAYEMNGEPLPPVHGAPLRVVVPGYIGARSVKWLTAITLQEAPSDNYFQSKAYRLFPQSMRPETVEYDQGMMLGDFPVSSVICAPLEGETLAAGTVTVKGWALAGGGRTVERVDVSTDGGRTWTVASLGSGSSPWTWRLWEAALDLSPGPQELICRAWDSAAHTQPEHPSQVWNFKGYVNNSWHRVRVTCA
ncbi:MAG TPA: sulfite oxidase [Thermoanaerobaculia bacterium]|nr:sulfite oxidase [Thermoanaerobaculia bacterium]